LRSRAHQITARNSFDKIYTGLYHVGEKSLEESVRSAEAAGIPHSHERVAMKAAISIEMDMVFLFLF
jgi:hypothetical protein